MFPSRRDILTWLQRQRDFFWIFFLPVSWLWWAIARARRAWRRPDLQEKLPVRVLSIGNIHSGGSGKTPFVAECVHALSSRKVAIVTRGYGGTTHGVARVAPSQADAVTIFGEEPVLLAQKTNVPVYVAPLRAAGIKEAIKHDAPDLILLDDGFQHLRVYRDADVVLINTDKPHEDLYCLPWGELREPLSALKKATAIGLIRGQNGSTSNWKDLLAKNGLSARVFDVTRKAIGLFRGEELVSLSPDEKSLAFCGIGAPHSFISDLSAFTIPAATHFFSDHHHYTRADGSVLMTKAAQVGATHLICTEKDGIKLRGFSELQPSLLTLRIQYEIPQEFWYFLQSFIA